MYRYVVHILEPERGQIIAHFWLGIDAQACADRLSTPNHPLRFIESPEYIEPGRVIALKEE